MKRISHKSNRCLVYGLIMMTFIILCSMESQEVYASDENTIVIANGEWLPFMSEQLKQVACSATLSPRHLL